MKYTYSSHSLLLLSSCKIFPLPVPSLFIEPTALRNIFYWLQAMKKTCFLKDCSLFNNQQWSLSYLKAVSLSNSD